MAYTTPPDFTPFDVLTAAQMDILGNNDVFFYTYTGTGTNAIQQVQYTMSTAVATTTSSIPIDDTIPQIGEGTQFMSQAITPKATTNLLEIEVMAFCQGSAQAYVVGAFFQDATANAIAAADVTIASNGFVEQMSLKHIMVAGTTSSTTFSFRMGVSTGTLTFNGASSSRYFGAITKSYIKVTEYKV